MQVREARPADAPIVLSLVHAKAQFDRELGAFTGSVANTEELILRHLFGPRPTAVVQLAVRENTVTGFALYYFRYSSFLGRPSIWLDDLYVQAQARRSGAGQLLMRRLAEVAVDSDCTHIAWIASASNAIGMNFYRTIGATIISQSGDTVTLQIDPALLLAGK
jgi:GNAT superfamily N-acetyltransferase